MHRDENIPQDRLKESGKIAFRLWLQEQFTDRCKRNPRYSLRAFARTLAMDASSLSQILSGKRPFSKKKMQLICKQLSASPKHLLNFGLLGDQVTHEKYNPIDFDTFTSISDWYHYAILEFTYVPGFRADPKWIAKKLSITTEEARSAIDRLKRLGLLMDEKGSLIKTNRKTTNHSAMDTSAAHQQLQKQWVEKALLAIDECPQNDKDITAITMAIDKANLPKARDLIRRFRRDLCELLEDGEPSQVYNLAIQLYPISKNLEEI